MQRVGAENAQKIQWYCTGYSVRDGVAQRTE